MWGCFPISLLLSACGNHTILLLEDGDGRLEMFNERRLRPIALMKEKEIQKEQFWNLLVTKMS